MLFSTVYGGIMLAFMSNIVSGSPVVNPSASQRTDAYDDLLGVTAVPTTLTSDGGVVYNHFFVNSKTSNALPGVNSVSPPNRALYNVLTSPSAVNPPSIATSQVCYQLQNFYFGCSLSDAQGVATAPVACTITLTGFDGNNKQVGSQSFSFTPTGATTSNMQLAKVTKIPKTKLINFSTAVANTALGGNTVVTLFDNVAYAQFGDSISCGVGF